MWKSLYGLCFFNKERVIWWLAHYAPPSPLYPFFFWSGLITLPFSCTVVNCIQCHPLDCVVATSGIDSTIKVRYNKDFRWLITIRRYNNMFITDADLDSKCFSPIHCIWWSRRTRGSKCVRCYGKQSAHIMPHSWNIFVCLVNVRIAFAVVFLFYFVTSLSSPTRLSSWIFHIARCSCINCWSSMMFLNALRNFQNFCFANLFLKIS